MDSIYVQVRFKEITEVGEYNGAIYFSFEDWDNVDIKQINDLKIVLVSDWRNSILNAPEPVELTQEEFQEHIKFLEAQVIDAEIQYHEKFIPTKEELQEKLDIIIAKKEEIETKIADIDDNVLVAKNINLKGK